MQEMELFKSSPMCKVRNLGLVEVCIGRRVLTLCLLFPSLNGVWVANGH